MNRSRIITLSAAVILGSFAAIFVFGAANTVPLGVGSGGSGQPATDNLTNWSNTATSVLATVAVPIGAILPWAKTLTGVPAIPASFVQCDGQTLSDAASPLNGTAIPNLNGNNQFVRGNSTSGSTGGAATHTHTFSGTTDNENGDTDVQDTSGSIVSVAAFAHTHSFSGTTGSGSSLPPYYNVVWIMRVK